MSTLAIIWQISLIGAVLGFWPSLYLIFSVWGHYSPTSSKKDVLSAPSQRIMNWFPVIVIPWAASVGIFLFIFLYLVFFVARR